MMGVQSIWKQPIFVLARDFNTYIRPTAVNWVEYLESVYMYCRLIAQVPNTPSPSPTPPATPSTQSPQTLLLDI